MDVGIDLGLLAIVIGFGITIGIAAWSVRAAIAHRREAELLAEIEEITTWPEARAAWPSDRGDGPGFDTAEIGGWP